ncbi:hypothetical protein [Aneurinibacillus soli]|uniref:hypothetical protein n=1 Tax=Aneurinibacillus soli TaxID=1500254 RepID=UPI001E4A1CAD|nr:hypothetical protein [Aneurinibacillus soli]
MWGENTTNYKKELGGLETPQRAVEERKRKSPFTSVRFAGKYNCSLQMTAKLAHKRSGCFLDEVLWAKARLSVLFRWVARTGVPWRLPSPLLPTFGQ